MLLPSSDCRAFNFNKLTGECLRIGSSSTNNEIMNVNFATGPGICKPATGELIVFY